MARPAPFGTWVSPIDAATLVEGGTKIAHPTLWQGRLLWEEYRPSEGGRQTLVAADVFDDGTIGTPEDLLPGDMSVRTKVHEYGGKCWVLAGDLLIISNQSDQRLWIVIPGKGAWPLTTRADDGVESRFADPVVTTDGSKIIAVRERHRAEMVTNDLVSISLPSEQRIATLAASTKDGISSSAQGVGAEPVVLAAGRDFYSSPRLSPDGSKIAWICWDLPHMPWDSSELWVADLLGDGVTGAARIAGGDEEAVTQPRWSSDGTLLYVSDEDGWFNLRSDGQPLAPTAAEFASPAWVFGESDHVVLSDGTLVAACSVGPKAKIGAVSGGSFKPFDVSYSSFYHLSPAGTDVLAVAASSTTAPAIVRIRPPDGQMSEAECHVLYSSSEPLMADALISKPDFFTFDTADGEQAHALLYLPCNPEYIGSEAELPPLIVMSHGGPTAGASASLNYRIQYWTTRGFAVVDVDYRGSSGYGREYRRALDGKWGLADVQDVIAAAGWLAAKGVVDANRMVVRGSSASGLVVLEALASSDIFRAGTVLYGVTDLALLATDTHKFESGYLERLVGQWPQDKAVYKQRSPIHHADQISRPLAVFQGLDDRVVPASQSQTIVDALVAGGVPVSYTTFEGEGHGFRKPETLIAVQEAELAFYGAVLGFEPADDLPRIIFKE